MKRDGGKSALRSILWTIGGGVGLSVGVRAVTSGSPLEHPLVQVLSTPLPCLFDRSPSAWGQSFCQCLPSGAAFTRYLSLPPACLLAMSLQKYAMHRLSAPVPGGADGKQGRSRGGADRRAAAGG